MHRYAVIDEKTKIVENTIIWDGETQWKPPRGYYLIRSNDCDVGDLHDIVEGMDRFTKTVSLKLYNRE